jgi:hypothetical protein
MGEMKTPWRIETERHWDGQPAMHRVKDAGGETVLSSWRIGGDCDNDFADDEAFPTIVRAVNAHDAMLAELRRLEWLCAGHGFWRCPVCGWLRDNAPGATAEHAPDCSLAAAIRMATQDA